MQDVMMNIQERSEKAMAYFREGYNCCQSVALAFSDVINAANGMSTEQIAALASGFGGGIARLREVCGCVSGMTMVAGALSPAPAAPSPGPGQNAPVSTSPGPGQKVQANGRIGENVDAMAARRDNYALVRELVEAFRKANGAIVCRELLGLKQKAESSPMPSERTPEYYKARPCERLIGSAAAILASRLADTQ